MATKFVLALAATAFIVGSVTAQSASDQLGDILASPDLAPAVARVLSDPPVLAAAAQSRLYPALNADAPATLEIVQAPIVQEVARNPGTLNEILTSPALLTVANSPDPEDQVQSLIAASRAPATGNAPADLVTLIERLGLAPQVSTTGRKMLQKV